MFTAWAKIIGIEKPYRVQFDLPLVVDEATGLVEFIIPEFNGNEERKILLPKRYLILEKIEKVEETEKK